MAEFHFRAKTTSRKGGRSAMASAAYRAGVVLRLDGEVFDYSRRRGIEAAFILTPDISPRSRSRKPLRLALDHLRTDRQALWQMVEDSETRKDAQLFRELEISLPVELTPAERRALIEGFVREHLTSQGMIADVAIHTGDAGGKDQQPHAHVMLTMRHLNADGSFGKKNRAWNEHSLVVEWRAAWAEAANAALDAAGHAARVDHRSLEDRRAEILAQIEAETDEVERLRLQGQAAALDYTPQPELSPTEWRAMESGDWPEAFAPKIAAFKAAAESKGAAAELSGAFAAAADELEQERAAEAEAAAQRAAQDAREAEEQRAAAELAEMQAEARRNYEQRKAEREAQRAAERAQEAQRAAERAQEAQRAAERARAAREAEESRLKASMTKMANSLGDGRLQGVAMDRATSNFRKLDRWGTEKREEWTSEAVSSSWGAGFLNRLSRMEILDMRVGPRTKSDDKREEVAQENLSEPSFIQRVSSKIVQFVKQYRDRSTGSYANRYEDQQKRERDVLVGLAWSEAAASFGINPEVRTRAEIMAEQVHKNDQSPTPPRRPRGGGLSM
jgi:hypothetical protein